MNRIRGLAIKLYNLIISFAFINKRNRICRKIRAILFHNICHEWKCSFGKKNSDRLFYVIRCSKSDLGFFGLYNTVLYHIQIAKKRGAEPIVDWCHYPNDYVLEDEMVGKKNAWEDYFEQMINITLDEVYKSKNVIMSAGGTRPDFEEIHHSELIKESHKLVKQYMRFNDDIQEKCINEYKNLSMENRKVLGVKCRGTDFSETKPRGHHICPNAVQTKNIIDEKEKEWGRFDYIFLATEDANIFAYLKEQYKERLIANKTHRIDETNGKWLNELFDSQAEIKHCKKERMTEYIISVYLLSQCDALIAPIIGATLGTLFMKNGEYEHFYLVQMGQY